MKKNEVPRLRMFAGPNGSGKSTLKSMIRPELLGVYINPDEIEKEIQDRGFLDLRKYQISTSSQEIESFIKKSQLIPEKAISKEHQFNFFENKLSFEIKNIDGYLGSLISDFIRKKLIEQFKSFTFETVMSHPDKIELLKRAQDLGYRTYLYYIATEDPSINISRVQYRVQTGGHGVPEDKIVTRYNRSLELLLSAIQYANRAYIFDNSTHEHIWIGEVTDGRSLEIKTDLIPAWFKTALLDKFQTVSSY